MGGMNLCPQSFKMSEAPVTRYEEVTISLKQQFGFEPLFCPVPGKTGKEGDHWKDRRHPKELIEVKMQEQVFGSPRLKRCQSVSFYSLGPPNDSAEQVHTGNKLRYTSGIPRKNSQSQGAGFRLYEVGTPLCPYTVTSPSRRQRSVVWRNRNADREIQAVSSKARRGED